MALKSRRFIYISTFILLSAFTAFYLVSSEDNRPVDVSDLDITRISNPPKEQLSQGDIQRDVETLIYTFERGYSGRLVYPEKYSQVIEGLRAIAPAFPKGVSQKEFYVVISSLLNSIPDGHLSASPAPTEHSALRTLASDHCEDNANGAPQLPTIELKKQGKQKILIVTVPSFMFQEGAENFINSFNDQVSNAHKVIVDLRGNSGGYESIPLRMAARLWGEAYREGNSIQYYPMPTKSSVALRNNVTYQLWANLNAIKDPTKFEFLKKYNQSLWFKLLNYNEYQSGGLGKTIYGAEDFASHTIEDFNTYRDDEPNLQEKGFPRPISIIVDKHCASACERFLESLEFHPYAKVIGEKTVGAAQFGHIGILRLPRSQIDVTISTAHITYEDNRVVERIGYQPDIKIRENEDPMKKALSL
ncbi:S41 family peptidase [Bdellovibrio bacteriovorus]|uniref:S41 family peptidase n=1 Tax=Bdellovibrio bacteriovorus TaxID=959 RepID=UPI003D0294C1